MKKKRLGKNGPLVTEICFGALPMGPLQAGLPLEEGAELIKYALKQGINFIDTADSYRTYSYIKEVLPDFNREDIIIASKSPAENYEEMEKDFKRGMKELDIDYFDIFHLHAAREAAPFKHRQGALNCLKDFKEKGILNQIGIATHYIKVVRDAAKLDDVDVIIAIINKKGTGIIDGKADEMLEALEYAHKQGKGIYAMKSLAGGNLLDELPEALNYVRRRDYIDSTALGVVSKQELKADLLLFNERKIPQKLKDQTDKTLKKIQILSGLCQKCGRCIEECPNEVLSMGKESVSVEHEGCIICGYCSAVCPEFCIRLA